MDVQNEVFRFIQTGLRTITLSDHEDMILLYRINTFPQYVVLTAFCMSNTPAHLNRQMNHSFTHIQLLSSTHIYVFQSSANENISINAPVKFCGRRIHFFLLLIFCQNCSQTKGGVARKVDNWFGHPSNIWLLSSPTPLDENQPVDSTAFSWR